MDENKDLPENQLIKLLKESKSKRIILTHISDPDGMWSGLEICKVLMGKLDLDYKDIALIPYDHSYGKNEIIKALIAELDFLAIVDLPPVGKSVEYYCDHHIGSSEIVEKYLDEKKIKHCFFDHNAPSALEMVKKLSKILFDVDLDSEITEPVKRSDSAKYMTDAPVTIEEFYSGDKAWRFDYLVKSSNDSPNDFISLFNILLEQKVDVVIEMPDYKNRILKIIEYNQQTKKLSESIDAKELTIVVGKDDNVVNRGLMFRIYNGKCKVAVTIAPKNETHYKVGFGTDPSVTIEEIHVFRVDEIAKSLGGGGHMRASGCAIAKENLEEAIEKIKKHYYNLKCLVVRV